MGQRQEPERDGGGEAARRSDVVRLRGGLYYGPEVTSASDIDGYQEWSISAEFAIFQNSALELGYADIEFDAKDGGEFDFEDGLFVRLQLRL